MNLKQARAIATEIEINQLGRREYDRREDEIAAAFHKLDKSNPTTADLRAEDLRLRNMIFREVGRATHPKITT